MANKHKANFKQRLIDLLIDEDISGISDMSRALCASADSIRPVLAELVDGGIVAKAGRGYRLSREVAVVMTKLYDTCAEIVVTLANGEKISRNRILYVEGMSSSENFARVFSATSLLLDGYRKRYKNLFTCLVCGEGFLKMNTVPSMYGKSFDRKELLTCGISKSDRSTPMYISRSTDLILLAHEKRAINGLRRFDQAVLDNVEAVFAAVKVDILYTDGETVENAEKLIEICDKLNVRLVISRGDDLRPDERAALPMLLGE